MTQHIYIVGVSQGYFVGASHRNKSIYKDIRKLKDVKYFITRSVIKPDIAEAISTFQFSYSRNKSPDKNFRNEKKTASYHQFLYHDIAYIQHHACPNHSNQRGIGFNCKMPLWHLLNIFTKNQTGSIMLYLSMGKIIYLPKKELFNKICKPSIV